MSNKQHSEADCHCGNYKSYQSTIQGVIVAPMMPMNTCVNCWRIDNPPSEFDWNELKTKLKEIAGEER